MLYYLLWLILCLAQVEIADIQKREKERYQNEKEKKIGKEISRIQSKNSSEIQPMYIQNSTNIIFLFFNF